jgi:hypothetical protein
LLRRGACHRAGHFGPDPLAPRDQRASNLKIQREANGTFHAPLN